MSTTKVLPVYPKFPEAFWGFRETFKYVGKKAVMPPTGLLTVMAMLPERFEAQKLVDLNVEPLTDEQIEISDIILTSTMIVQEESHNEVVDRAHSLGKKVVAGGPFVTTYPERTNADYIVAGEAEVTLRPFLEDLLNGSPQGIWTEKSVSGRLPVQLTKGGKVEITQTPLPRWDLLDLKKYFSAAIQYSRGCPFDCDFCDITKLFGREARTKTPGQMRSELDALYNLGHRGSVFIVDDNFIGNRKNVKQLLPHIAEWQQERRYPFSLFTEASMNLAWDNNRDILEGMQNAGFNSVFLGIESVDNEVLKIMHKGQNTKMSQLEAVRRIQQAGLEVSGGFIIGSDGEKRGSLDKLYNFIQEAGIVVSMPGLLTAIKGTDLYNRLEREGRLRGDSNGNNTHHLEFNFETKTELREEELLEGYKGLLGKLFNAKGYFERCRILQKNQGPHHRTKRSALEGFVILGRSIKGQLFTEGGWEYAKYLVGTVLTNPGYFPEAVAQAIKFDHFDTITKATLKADDYTKHAQSLYSQFSEKAGRIIASGKGNYSEKLNLISKTAENTLGRANEKYQRLHKDFRRGAEEVLRRLDEMVNAEVEGYKTRAVSG
jgi:radical SAM superfamily enzyme YgiQ (UPF0313 family)